MKPTTTVSRQLVARNVMAYNFSYLIIAVLIESLMKDFVTAVENVTVSDEKILIQHLLKEYEQIGVVGRPVFDTSQTVKVKYGLSLIQIQELDGKSQILMTNVWNKYAWKDMLLAWDPGKFGGVKKVRVPVNNIWKPDVVLYNYADPKRLKEYRNALAIIEYTGDVTWIPPAIFRSTCPLDILYFPFDTQNCYLKFGSWTYDGFRLDLDFYDDLAQVDTSDYVQSNEWKLLEYPAKKTNKTYPCCVEPYPDLTFFIKVKRIAIFYSFTLIVPCILLSLLTLVSFWLPPETPAKMLLGMNIFVAFFLLLRILANLTPASSAVPLIGVYFCLNLVLITLSSFISATVINLYMRTDKKNKVPSWLKKLTIDGLSQILCMEQRKYLYKKKPRRDHVTHHVTHVIDGTLEGRKSREKTIKSPVLPYNKWEHQPSSYGDSPIATRNQICLDKTDPFLITEELLEVEVKEIKRVLRSVMAKLQMRDAKDRIAQEWRLVALSIDRLFFIIYLLTIIVSCTVIALLCFTSED